MKTPPSSGHETVLEAVNERLDAFAAYLTPRYESLEELPVYDGRVGRWVARRISDGAVCMITIMQYGGNLLTSAAVETQEAIARRMDACTCPRLGQLLEWHLTPEAHFIVCTLPGAESLHSLLRRRHALPHVQTCRILHAVAEAIAEAIAAEFPPPVPDACLIFLPESGSMAPEDGLQLPLPPMPGPEALEGEGGAGAASQAVQDLAYLACDLLGMPARGTRFRPVPHLSAATNRLLVGAIDGNSSILEAGPVAFANAFGGQSVPARPVAMPDTTANAAVHAPASVNTTTTSTAGARRGVQTPLPSAPAALQREPVSRPPAEPLPATTRLRLTPRAAGQPVLILAGSDSISVGRSGDADFVMRFHPRSARNDLRTRVLSREHVIMSLENGQLRARNHPEANTTFCSGQPITGALLLTQSCRLSVGGEYELDVLRLPSAWAQGDVWGEGPAVPAGSILLRPAPSPSMAAWDIRTLWIFTDVPLALGPDGSLRSIPESDRGALGWILRSHDQFWLMAAEDEGSLLTDGVPLKAREPRLLRAGSVLRIGRNEWDVTAPGADKSVASP